MEKTVKKESWVEIGRVILAPDERAPQVPEDTKKVPLEMRVKGFLLKDAHIGGQATVTTVVGRSVTGTLISVNPPYEHGFGAPIDELTSIGRQSRRIVAEYEKKQEK
jgi:2-amino-4-ketopentanoate thiolase alpha subunit